jgi:hypothetical protein
MGRVWRLVGRRIGPKAFMGVGSTVGREETRGRLESANQISDYAGRCRRIENFYIMFNRQMEEGRSKYDKGKGYGGTVVLKRWREEGERGKKGKQRSEERVEFGCKRRLW